MTILTCLLMMKIKTKLNSVLLVQTAVHSPVVYMHGLQPHLQTFGPAVTFKARISLSVFHGQQSCCYPAFLLNAIHPEE